MTVPSGASIGRYFPTSMRPHDTITEPSFQVVRAFLDRFDAREFPQESHTVIAAAQAKVVKVQGVIGDLQEVSDGSEGHIGRLLLHRFSNNDQVECRWHIADEKQDHNASQ